MKQEDAVQHLRTIMFVLQKFRSNSRDPILGIIVPDDTPGLQVTESLAAETWPWVFGDKCPLPALMQILDAVNRTQSLAPMDYYNQMIILDRFMPEVKAAAGWFEVNRTAEQHIPDGPPDVSIFAGWDLDRKELT